MDHCLQLFELVLGLKHNEARWEDVLETPVKGVQTLVGFSAQLRFEPVNDGFKGETIWVCDHYFARCNILRVDRVGFLSFDDSMT